ncbi:MAG: TIGR00266 family protein [Snowella sp.]|nr:TIGR00266 family protein [Snowella sp.]
MEGNLINNSIDRNEKKKEIEEEHDLDFSIENGPLYSSLILDLKPSQTVLAEASVIEAMDSSITLIAKLQDGLLKTLTKALGKELLFINQFAAEFKPGRLFLAPPLPGHIHHYYLTGRTGILLQSSHFIACVPTVQIDIKFLGMKNFFNDTSTFLLRTIGQGDVWFSSYGGLVEITVQDDFLVDTGYVVAFEDTLNYDIEMIEGLVIKSDRTKYYGGKGLVCRFKGEGKVWIQARQTNAFLNFIE